MKETSIFHYYAFGYDYHTLQDGMDVGDSIHGDQNSLVSRLQSFFSDLEALDLRVTATAAADLKLLFRDILLMPKDATLDQALIQKLKAAVDKCDTTLDAELKLKSAYVMSPRRFPLEHLLQRPDKMFAPKTYERFPPLSQYDFSEAGRSIAFGMATAAAFHILRGTEGILRLYYCEKVKRNRLKVLTWGNMVDSLRKRRTPPPKPLLDGLDNIRYNFRNPTQHPESRYDIDEAQDLLSVCIDAANRMMRDLPVVEMTAEQTLRDLGF